MKRIGIFMIWLNLFSLIAQSQIVEEKLENADYFKNGDFIYVHNIENNRTLNIKKYDLNLKVVGSFTKTYQKDILKNKGDNLYSVIPFDSTISIRVQFTKGKQSSGLTTTINFNLKELQTEEWTEYGRQLTGWKYVWGEVPNTKSYNAVNESVYEKEVINKLFIRGVGPLLSIYNDKDSCTIQIANYGVTKDKMRYTGFYILRYVNKTDKVIYLNKYPFYKFKSLGDKNETYMEFYPDLVIKQGQNYLVPFAQKAPEVITRTYVDLTTGDKFTDVAGKYQILGVGVLEINSKDMSLKTFNYDREKIKEALRYEFIVGFKAKDLNNFSILTKNFPSVDDKTLLKPNEHYIYTKYGEKLNDSGKNLQILLIDSKSCIKFDFNKNSYKMEKVLF